MQNVPLSAATFARLFLGLSILVSLVGIHRQRLQVAVLSTVFMDSPTIILSMNLPENERLSYWPSKMQAWELQAIEEGVCHPPHGIPTMCCPSSTYTRGYDANNFGGKSGGCFKNASIYLKAERLALSLLPELDDNTTTTQQHCDVCRIFDLLAQHNLTLTFVGDSMVRQTYQALECEFHRRTYSVSPLDIQPIVGLDKGEWRTQIKTYDTFHVGKGKDAFNTTSSSNTATFRLFHVYRPNNGLVPYLANTSDIVIFDHGLHFIEQQSHVFRRHVQSFVDAMQPHNIPLLWRGTSAQHWNISGGYYARDFQTKGQQCYPVNYTEHRDFHHEIMQEMFQKKEIGNSNQTTRLTGILPFREFSTHFHDLHQNQGDCTHYCHLPAFWLYLWRHLRLELERIVPLMNIR